MVKFLASAFVSILIASGYGQATNPQNTFPNAVNIAVPSTYLNFNDPTTSFLDNISGLDFVSTLSRGASTVGGGYASPTATGGNPRVYTMAGDFIGNGTVSSITLQWATAPTAGATYALAVATDNGSGSYTTTAYVGSVTVAATTAPQTFVSGAGLPVFTAKAGQTVQVLVGTGQTSIGYATGTVNYWGITASAFPSIGVPTAYSHSSLQVAFSATMNSSSVTSPGTAIPQQPGFDSTQSTQYSAAFPYNAWNAAPNATLGSIEWNVPWTMMAHVDRLNWNRSGTLVLASKGDIGNIYGSWWKLYLQMSGLFSQLCFERNSSGATVPTAGDSTKVQTGTCTATNFDAMPNGFNYNLMVTDTGTGATVNGGATSPLTLYINGLPVGRGFGNTYSTGFGYAALTIGSGGTGFTGTTPFTSTGGGTNCTVNGNVTESGGALNAITTTHNFGCTSNPTIVLTAPTGTGGSIAAVAQTTSMNDTTLPLLVPGYVSGGSFYGIDAADSTQTSTYVDEFAIFPGVLTAGQIAGIYNQTKYYQMIANAVSNKPVVVYENGSGGDADDQFSFNMLIAMHKAGLITLAGVTNADNSGSCLAMWRQMLDHAGLNDIPVSTPDEYEGTGTCYPSNVTAYNASTPQTVGAYESAVTMWRTIFAKYPTRPIDILDGSAVYAGLYDFMSSPADGISSLTGLQLLAQDAANGGQGFFQGGGCTASSPPVTIPCTGGMGGTVHNLEGQYIMSNNGSFPLIFIGGTPMNAGPGVSVSRTSLDPLWLYLNSVGTDIRQCYDCLINEGVSSTFFTGGVQINYSGGTGYANITPFTISGCGANFPTEIVGDITASGGVPNGVTTVWGLNAYKSYPGVAYGCAAGSTPTVNLVGSTGSGGTFTAYPTTVCGTDVVTNTGGTYSDVFTATGSNCSSQYVAPYTWNANQTPVSGEMMTWFINSLVNPETVGRPIP